MEISQNFVALSEYMNFNRRSFYEAGNISIKTKKLCGQVVIKGHLTKNYLLPSGPKSICDPTGNPISVGPVSSWRHSRTETIERLFVCSSKHYSPRTSDYVCSQSDESNKRGV